MAACPAALAEGVGIGMAVTHARVLVSDLDVRPADREADAHLLERLALRAVRSWTPVASVSGHDGLWLDLTGVAHLFGGEERLCRRIIGFCRRAGFTARIAVADTPGVSVLAHFRYPSGLQEAAVGVVDADRGAAGQPGAVDRRGGRLGRARGRGRHHRQRRAEDRAEQQSARQRPSSPA